MKAKTIGLSPKLYPSLIAIAVGLLLILVGEKEAGLGIVGTGVASLGAGAALGPGEVEIVDEPPRRALTA